MRLKHLLLPVLFCCFFAEARSQNTRVQFINNCPDLAISGLDIYINGTLVTNDLFFRQAAPFMDVVAGTQLNIGLANQNSVSVADTFYNKTITLSLTNTYVMVANGIKSTSGYFPTKPFVLSVSSIGRESAFSSFNTDLLLMHGSTDAMQTFDLRSGITTWANDVSYGQFASSYAELPTADYILRLSNAFGSATFRSYDAPLNSTAMHGKSLVVLTSGFVNPSANSNGASFGLWAAMSSGGPLIQLSEVAHESIARVQIINNSADSATDLVDVYIDTEKVLTNFPFRHATAFFDWWGNVTADIGIAYKNSNSVNDTFYHINTTLDSGGTYIFITSGIKTASGYTPATPFDIDEYGFAKEDATAGNTEIITFNGSTDGPALSISQGSTILSNNLTHGNFSNYTSLATADATIDISGYKKLKAMMATWSLHDKSAVLLSSGFADSTKNKHGPGFGIYLAPSTGGPLLKLPEDLSVPSIKDNQEAAFVYPNPVDETLYIAAKVKATTAAIYDITGRLIKQTTGLSNNTINVKGLNSGVYFILIQTKETTFSQRFIKE